MDVSVVVPIHNEAESIAELIVRIGHAFEEPILSGRQCELILVDDGSTDDTFLAASQIAEVIEGFDVRIISLRRNYGQTAAMQTGFEAATGQIIVSIDGDLQNDPADIPRMIKFLELHDLDILCGRRKNRRDSFWSRKLPSWFANRLIGWATKVPISDYGCSLKVYRGEILHQLRLIGEMHRFIPAWFSQVTSISRIAEMDVNHFPRQHGKTHYGISRTLRVILDLLSVVFFTRFKNRPGHFFGMIGLGMLLCGFAMLGWAFVDKFFVGKDIGGTPMLIIGALAFFSGIQMVSTGIVAELLSRVYLQTSPVNRPSILREYSNQRGNGLSLARAIKAA